MSVILSLPSENIARPRVEVLSYVRTASAARLASRSPLMIVRTVEQVRRAFRIVAGFTLLLAGVVMLITPGPGWLVIFLGLSLLAAEFIWARRLMDRMKREGERVRDAVWPIGKNNSPASAAEESPNVPKPE